MNLTMEARPRASRTRVRMLCEGALLVAAAQILSYVKFLELPNGGALTPAMFPVLLFALLWGGSPSCGTICWPSRRWAWPVCSGAAAGASLPGPCWAAPGGSWCTMWWVPPSGPSTCRRSF